MSRVIATKFEEQEFNDVCESFNPNGGINPGTLFYHAKETGVWDDPRTVAANQDSYGDIKNARLFSLMFRGKLIFVASTGKWMQWTDEHWQWCEKMEEMHCAKLVAEKLMLDAQALFKDDPDHGKRHMQHAMNSHNLSRLEATVKLAISEQGMTATLHELDTDPMLVGVQNGVVDLKLGVLLINRPEMLITRSCNASFTLGAQCPRWQKFLLEVFEGDLETIETIQRALGYTLTGSITEEVIFICFGRGSNGKSVFNNVTSAIYGDYARMAPPSLLTARSNSDTGPRNDLAALAGSRYVAINELQSGDKLDEQIVKLLAGREKISARFLHKEFFEYMPTFKPWLRTNHKPIVTGDDDGIWRRLVLIPFSRSFSAEEKDPYLESKLMAEIGRAHV